MALSTRVNLHDNISKFINLPFTQFEKLFTVNQNTIQRICCTSPSCWTQVPNFSRSFCYFFLYILKATFSVFLINLIISKETSIQLKESFPIFFYFLRGGTSYFTPVIDTAPSYHCPLQLGRSPIKHTSSM